MANPSQRKIHGVTTGAAPVASITKRSRPPTAGVVKRPRRSVSSRTLTGLRLDDEDAVGRRDPADHGRVRLQLDVELAPGGGERQRPGVVGATNTCGHLQRRVVEQLGQGGVEAP